MDNFVFCAVPEKKKQQRQWIFLRNELDWIGLKNIVSEKEHWQVQKRKQEILLLA